MKSKMTLKVFKCFWLMKNRRLQLNVISNKCTFHALTPEKVMTAMFDNQNLFV